MSMGILAYFNITKITLAKKNLEDPRTKIAMGKFQETTIDGNGILIYKGRI